MKDRTGERQWGGGGGIYTGIRTAVNTWVRHQAQKLVMDRTTTRRVTCIGQNLNIF